MCACPFIEIVSVQAAMLYRRHTVARSSVSKCVSMNRCGSCVFYIKSERYSLRLRVFEPQLEAKPTIRSQTSELLVQQNLFVKNVLVESFGTHDRRTQECAKVAMDTRCGVRVLGTSFDMAMTCLEYT